ncbi:MAG: hypothetical protein ACE5MK_10330 [Acidobacteriota bacterium]
MADYFVDTSALGKHYHEEVGTARVDQLLGEPQSRHPLAPEAPEQRESSGAADVCST